MFLKIFFFWRTLAPVFLVLGPEHSCLWPREGSSSEGLSLAAEFFCVLGLQPCVLDSTSAYNCVASSKTSWNDIRGVSASRPLPFGPGMAVTIFRLGVLLAFLGVVCYRYSSLPRTSSVGSFSSQNLSHIYFNIGIWQGIKLGFTFTPTQFIFNTIYFFTLASDSSRVSKACKTGIFRDLAIDYYLN